MVQVSARDATSADALQSEYLRLTQAIVSGAAAQTLPLTYLVVQVGKSSCFFFFYVLAVPALAKACVGHNAHRSGFWCALIGDIGRLS